MGSLFRAPIGLRSDLNRKRYTSNPCLLATWWVSGSEAGGIRCDIPANMYRSEPSVAGLRPKDNLDGMTNRAKFLLLATAISLLMWGGIIGGGILLLSDGVDRSFTAGTR